MNAINFLSNGSVSVFEIKSTGVPVTESIDKKYQWFLIVNGEFTKLTFVSMDISEFGEQRRTFKEGILGL